MDTYNPNDEKISFYHYNYDSQGRKTEADTHNGKWTYSYDKTGQLKPASFESSKTDIPSRQMEYFYDKSGNRTSVIVNNKAKNYSVNRVSWFKITYLNISLLLIY